MLPLVMVAAVSAAGAAALTIRYTWAEPVGVKLLIVIVSPVCAEPLTLTSMTQTLVGLVGESEDA